MSGRERQQWTEYVRQREGRKDEKPVRKWRSKKQPLFSPADLETSLDDLITEATRRAQPAPLAAPRLSAAH